MANKVEWCKGFHNSEKDKQKCNETLKKAYIKMGLLKENVV